MRRLAPGTTSISTSCPALNGYWESVTMSAGIVMYWVLLLRLCSIRAFAFKTMRVPLVKPCGGSIEKAAAGDDG